VAARQRLPMFSRLQCSAGLTDTRRKDNKRRLCLDHAKKLFIYRGLSYLHEQKNNGVNYHHYYSPALSVGLLATEGRMCDASESKAGRTKI
jgi:hypothetical protein